ncbi:MAG: type II toxin-antitoxin system VapC family toxin [Candidatus Competibacteraceae bacterium]
MRLLLDTHTLLWLVDGHPNLSGPARSVLMDLENDLFVSVASILELAIKTTKPNQPLILNDPLDIYLAKWLPVYQLTVLPILQAHALELLTLPDHHRDPFDRILIAQARQENMTVVTADGKFADYPITIVW